MLLTFMDFFFFPFFFMGTLMELILLNFDVMLDRVVFNVVLLVFRLIIE